MVCSELVSHTYMCYVLIALYFCYRDFVLLTELPGTLWILSAIQSIDYANEWWTSSPGKEELGLSSTCLDSRVSPLQPHTVVIQYGGPFRSMTSH